MKTDEQLDEIKDLRAVYENARSFLRYSGADTEKARKAFQRLTDSVEVVKMKDSSDE